MQDSFAAEAVLQAGLGFVLKLFLNFNWGLGKVLLNDKICLSVTIKCILLHLLFVTSKSLPSPWNIYYFCTSKIIGICVICSELL